MASQLSSRSSRALALALLPLLLTACFRPTPLTEERAVQIWRSSAARQQPRLARQQGSLTLGVEQAVALALQNNPSLKELNGEVEITRASVDEEAQLENPQIRLRDFELDKAAKGAPTMDLALRVPVPQPWLRSARLKRAELRVEETRAQLSNLTRQLRARVRKLYARLAGLAAQTTELDRSIERLSMYRGLAEQRVKEGASTRLDASRPLLRYAQAVDLRHELRLQREETVSELRRLIGAQPNQQIVFSPASDDLAIGPPALDEATLTQQALARRLDLREAASKVGVAEAEVYLAKAQRWPWLRFAEVGYNFRSNLDPLNFMFAVALDVPLLSWNRGAIAVREAALTRRRLQEQAAVLAAAQEVSEAAARVRGSMERLHEMERSMLPMLKDSARAAEEAASRGVVDPQRAMTEEWQRARAQTRYLRALLEHREAVIDLEAAVGSTLTSEQP